MTYSRSYHDSDFDVESDQQALERMLTHYQERSATSYDSLLVDRDLAYGPGPAERLDVFRPEGSSLGVVVFFHGGWWRMGSKESRAFLAQPAVRAGYHFVNVEYPLAPAATLREIVSCAERAMGWVGQRIQDYGGNPERIIVSGNSAGGHLAACCCSLESLAAAGIEQESVRGLVGVSGIYDLAPLRTLVQNDWLNLDDHAIATLSPAARRFPRHLRVHLAYGSLEPRGFGDQSAAFRNTLAKAGLEVALEALPGEEHLTIIAQVTDFAIALAHRLEPEYR